jgi:hypothetical protein
VTIIVLKVLEVSAGCAHGHFGRHHKITFPHSVSGSACQDSVARGVNLFSYNYTSPPSSIERGIQSEGHLVRMQRLQAKVAEGESVTIGVAGASFSTGYHADWESKKGCAYPFTCVCHEQG